jgi:hypothetical protein
MAPRIQLKKNITARSSEWALFDNQTERIYQRISGGIILQGPRGSAAAVVAEGAILRPPAPIFLVRATTRADAAGIIECAQEFQQDLHCDSWQNDYSDKAALRFLDQLNNRSRERRAKPLLVSKVAHADSGLGFFLNVLKEALTPGRKLLHLEEFEGEVNSALAAISSVEITKAKFEDHPLVTALAIAVAPLISNSYIYGREQQRFALTEGNDIFGHKIQQDYFSGKSHQKRALTEYDIFNNNHW